MNLGKSRPDSSFWREVMRAYRFPIVMFALAIIPGFNFTYSGHGVGSLYLSVFRGSSCGLSSKRRKDLRCLAGGTRAFSK